MEIKQPFFSVIIPTTGGRLENLELVLTSLSVQHFPKQMFEVIVVNDGGEEEAQDITNKFYDSIGARYYYTDKFEPLDFDKSIDDIKEVRVVSPHTGCDGPMFSVPNIQPRNKGTLFASSDFFIFADSDIILSPNALSLYFQDMMQNPDRVVLGVYHWLYPMHVTPNDVLTRFDDIINERLAKKLLEEVEPDGKQTHNIMRDLRMQDFNAHTPDEVLTYPGHLNVALAAFSGNICWPRSIFEDIGGYTPYLAAGAHEDGFSGLTLYKAGHGISYDNRIVGGHLYHHRNAEWVEWLKWKRGDIGELAWLNSNFKDFDEMTDIVKDTEAEHKRLGVADWKEKGGLGW